MQSDQQIISQLGDGLESAKQTLEDAKQHHKARILALRNDQIQAQVRGYEKALKAVTKSNGQGESQQQEKRFQIRA